MGMRRSTAERLVARHLGVGAGHGPGSRANKFSAKRAVSADGKSFASTAERDRYQELQRLQAQGLIADLELQPKWHFVINGQPMMSGKRKTRYTADFRYRAADGCVVVEDVKGMMTRDAALRIELLRLVHGITVQIVQPRRIR